MPAIEELRELRRAQRFADSPPARRSLGLPPEPLQPRGASPRLAPEPDASASPLAEAQAVDPPCQHRGRSFRVYLSGCGRNGPLVTAYHCFCQQAQTSRCLLDEREACAGEAARHGYAVCTSCELREP